MCASFAHADGRSHLLYNLFSMLRRYFLAFYPSLLPCSLRCSGCRGRQVCLDNCRHSPGEKAWNGCGIWPASRQVLFWTSRKLNSSPEIPACPQVIESTVISWLCGVGETPALFYTCVFVFFLLEMLCSVFDTHPNHFTHQPTGIIQTWWHTVA